jgi:hypothetical protein
MTGPIASPLVVSAALELPQESFVMDGRSSYYSRKARPTSTRWPPASPTSGHCPTLSIFAGDGEDLRPWSLALRKGALAGLLSDPVDGI